MTIPDYKDLCISVTGGQRCCQREGLFKISIFIGNPGMLETGHEAVFVRGSRDQYLRSTSHSNNGKMIIGSKAIDQVSDALFCFFKSTWSYISSLHTGRRLQDDDGVTPYGAANKRCRPGEDKHDDNCCQDL